LQVAVAIERKNEFESAVLPVRHGIG